MYNLISFFKENKFQSFWIIVASFLINILALSGALYVIQVFNKYLNYKQESTLLALTVGIMIALSLELFLRIIRNFLLNKSNSLNSKKISNKIIEQLLTFKLIIKNRFNESFLNINPLEKNDINSGEALIAIIDILFIIIFLLVISLLSTRLGSISLFLTFLFIFIIFIKIKIKKYLTKHLSKFSNKTNMTINDIKNIPETIRAFNAKHILIDKFRLYYARQRVKQKAIRNILGFFSSINIMYPTLSTIVIIYFGAQEVNVGNLTIGASDNNGTKGSFFDGEISNFRIIQFK